MVPRHFHGRFRQQSSRRAAAAAPVAVLAEAHCAPSHGNPQEHTKQQCLGTPYISTEARSVDPATLQEMPERERSEGVRAVVVLRQLHRGQVDEGDIVAWCRNSMVVCKAPRVAQFVDVLPTSGSGKVMWRTLRVAEPH